MRFMTLVVFWEKCWGCVKREREGEIVYVEWIGLCKKSKAKERYRVL